MRNIKSYLLLTLALLMIPIAVMAQEHLPVWIEEAKIDGITIDVEGDNSLNMERGSELELKLYLLADEDVEDIEIDASFSGYEYEKISAHLSSFDVEADTLYTKKLKLQLPEDMDKDEYLLRVIISDRYNYEQVYSYNIKIDSQRHELKLQDLILNPNNNVMAGTGFIAKVRLENLGQRDEEDIKVTIGLPELDIRASEYIDEIEEEDEKESEEIFIRLPKCAEPGEYIVAVEALYNNDHDKVSGFTKINVLENPACKKAEETKQEKQIQIVIPENTEKEQQMPPVEEKQPAKSNASNMRTVLEIALIVLVALLIIIGFAIGFSKWKQDE